jgi:hypothetical protein
MDWNKEHEELEKQKKSEYSIENFKENMRKMKAEISWNWFFKQVLPTLGFWFVMFLLGLIIGYHIQYNQCIHYINNECDALKLANEFNRNNSIKNANRFRALKEFDIDFTNFEDEKELINEGDKNVS